MSWTPAPPTRSTAEYKPLTKGVEFEFVIPYRYDVDRSGRMEINVPEGVPAVIVDGCVILSQKACLAETGMTMEWRYTEQQVRGILCDVLKNAGIDVTTNANGERENEKHPNAWKTTLAKYYRWGIGGDVSLATDSHNWWPNPGQPYWFVDVELVSPVLAANSDSADDEISNVLKTIKEHFVCFTPKSCGLHIHIGQGRHMFSYKELRKIAALLYMTEKMYVQLHPHWRQNDPYNHPNAREHSNVAQGMKHKVDASVGDIWYFEPIEPDKKAIASLEEALEELLQCEDTWAVSKLMSTPQRGANNFQNIMLEDRPTIEFRQAAGTLNAEWVIHWSKILTQTVDRARKVSEEELWGRLLPLFKLRETGNPNALTTDRWIRELLQLPQTADYIRDTIPTSRTHPVLTDDQRLWYLRSPLVRCLGPGISPEEGGPELL